MERSMKSSSPQCEEQKLAASSRRKFLRLIGVTAGSTLVGMEPSHGQGLPETTRIIVPFPGGNPVENSTRALVQALNKTSSRSYIVDNKPGATGLLGAAEAAKARGDGSVLLMVTGGFTTSPVLFSKLPYDTFNDFRGVTQKLTAPGFALLVRASSPYRTVQDLIRAAQQKPNTVSYASLGNGGVTHLIGALFGRAVKAEFLHVPYRASPMPDLLGGHVDTHWSGTTISRPLVASGQVRILATSSPNRIPEAPDAPTFAELGLQEVDVPAWLGYVAPRSMTPDLASRIHQEIATATQHPDFVAYIKAAGNDVINTPPTQFDAYLRAEVNRYAKVLPPLGIRMD
jgi:tripartite-type tricarboxylate transporter receptor subunit TctC